MPQEIQSLIEQEKRWDILNRLVEAPASRTIRPRRKLGPVNQTTDTTSGNSRSETTTTSREKRRPDRPSLMWSRPIPFPWHIYKQDLKKLNLQTKRFAADAMKMLNSARLSVNGLHSIVGVDWLMTAEINNSSTTVIRLADLEGLP